MRLPPLFAALLLITASGFVPAQESREARLADLHGEIERLEQELGRLRLQEGGVLDDLERLSAELSLGQTKLRALSLRNRAIVERIAAHEQTLETLERSQQERRSYMAFRLREIYKAGSRQTLHRLLGDRDSHEYWAAMRYAAFLNEQDRGVLARYREDRQRVDVERKSLLVEQERLAATRREVQSANRRLDAGRARQRRLLDEIRGDTARREFALAELRSAAEDLATLIGDLDPAATRPALDMNKFKGLLDWPAEGEVRSGFGTVVHPKFKTTVPHPGIDIRAASGDPIRSVFDGEVVFSGWMRGYGLTTIVDHGHGLHSVYAHASVTWLEPGEQVRRGQRLGIVGETGSFSGPSLYFELRLNGRAVDPAEWLRRR